LLGDAKALNGRFPVLIKLLDAREKLSLQVHPPASKAAELVGEPKTEMWYIADAAPGAELYVGLHRGVTRTEFEKKIADGSIADCFHRVPVKSGDTMFLPSGRVHAIGAGLVIFEIQQNSDTTYRVFDWNRVGLDGKPRELHVAKSLASIDFNDFEPPVVKPKVSESPDLTIHRLVEDPLFCVELWKPKSAGKPLHRFTSQMQIIGAVSGSVTVKSNAPRSTAELTAGGFCLIPATVPAVEFIISPDSQFLRVTCSQP
jgi:mannose-6-phosphate isomerase